MVKWSQLQNATAPDNKPTPGWLFHEIVRDVKGNPMECADVAEYLMQCVCSDQLNTQLKAVLCIKHLCAEGVTFQQFMQSCPGALKVLEEIAAPPIVPQARSLEPQEVKMVREATMTAIAAIHKPHTLEKSTEAACLKSKIQGFGNFEPPQDEEEVKAHGVVGQVADFVGDSVGDMVDDFREKGAVGALKDATIDALDLVLDGVDAMWGWVAGKPDDQASRICQPSNVTGSVGMPPGSMVAAGPFVAPVTPIPGVFNAPTGGPSFQSNVPSTSATSHYTAAFGGGVVGANNPVHFGTEAPAPVGTTSTSTTGRPVGLHGTLAYTNVCQTGSASTIYPTPPVVPFTVSPSVAAGGSLAFTGVARPQHATLGDSLAYRAAHYAQSANVAPFARSGPQPATQEQPNEGVAAQSVDLLSMEEPAAPQAPSVGNAVPDLLPDLDSTPAQQHAAANMLDL